MVSPPRTANRASSSASFSTIPVYSSSAIGSIAAPKKPCRRMSMAFAATRSRTVFQNGWAKQSCGSERTPSCAENAAQLTSGGPSK